MLQERISQRISFGRGGCTIIGRYYEYPVQRLGPVAFVSEACSLQGARGRGGHNPTDEANSRCFQVQWLTTPPHSQR